MGVEFKLMSEGAALDTILKPIYEVCKEDFNHSYINFIDITSPNLHNHSEIKPLIDLFQ